MAAASMGAVLACSSFSGGDEAPPEQPLPPDAGDDVTRPADPDVTDAAVDVTDSAVTTPCDPMFATTTPISDTDFENGTKGPWTDVTPNGNCSGAVVDGASKVYRIDCTATGPQISQLQLAPTTTSFVLSAQVTDPVVATVDVPLHTILQFSLTETAGTAFGTDPTLKFFVLPDGTARVSETISTGQVQLTTLPTKQNALAAGGKLELAYRPPTDSVVGQLGVRIDGFCAYTRNVIKNQTVLDTHTHALLQIGFFSSSTANGAKYVARTTTLDDLVLRQ